jgi:hypothetical protein
MDSRFLRDLAWQARKLLPLARTDFARAQLRLWIAEFEALAATAEIAAFRVTAATSGALHRPSDQPVPLIYS